MGIKKYSQADLVIQEIKVDSVLKTNKHIDGGWFWSKYSAYPYIGCQYGCTYCFLRMDMYGLNTENNLTKNLKDPFSQFVRIKTNAAEILDKELSKVPKDIIITGDYQPIESRFRLSRKMLEVCYKRGFPTLIIAKSPLVMRDLDLIKRINEKSWACVVFSINSSGSKGYREIFEPFASSIESRFASMKTLGEAGIYTGTALMPVLPFITDSDENLESIVKLTKENSGRFVLGGGLVLSDRQESAFYESAEKYRKGLAEKYKGLYQAKFSPTDSSWAFLGKKIKAFCQKHGLDYRIRRFIPNSPLAINKKVAENLFLWIYEMELEGMEEYEAAMYRELAWLIDEFPIPLTNILEKDMTARLIESHEMIDRGVLQIKPILAYHLSKQADTQLLANPV